MGIPAASHIFNADRHSFCGCVCCIQISTQLAGDDDGLEQPVLIAVDRTDLGREPELDTDTRQAVNQLAINAADVAGLITCQQQRHDVVTSSSGSDVSDDVIADDVTRSRVAGDGQCDDGVDVIQLSQFACRDSVSETWLRHLIWMLSMKHLRRDDWKKLARYWQFSDQHLLAIESSQFTGLSCLSTIS